MPSRQLHFVTGKGGVGKSTVACALATRFVDEGHTTLLCQVNAKDSHSSLLGIPAVEDDLMQVGPRLWTVNFTPAQATREYALMTLKIEALYKAVFENRLTKTFLRFVPSLNELTMMGKLWFHAEEEASSSNGSGRRFERIVVDCPSTGHALKLFTVARVLTETVRVGPMVDKTKQMSAVFKDPARSVVHLVTLPEELPVNETLELLEKLTGEAAVTAGHLIVNQRLSPIFDEKRRALLQKLLPDSVSEDASADADPDTDADEDALAPVFAVGRRRAAREALEGRQVERAIDTGLPVLVVPLQPECPLGPTQVARIAGLLGGVQ